MKVLVIFVFLFKSSPYIFMKVLDFDILPKMFSTNQNA